MHTTVSSSTNTSSSKKLEPCHVLQPLGYYLVFVWILGTLFNGLVLLLFMRHKALRQSSTNIFIAGLVLIDFLGATTCLPMPTWSLLSCRWYFGRAGCVLEAILTYFAGCSNMYMLCLISIDRYFVVTRSFSVTVITNKTAYITTACIYALSMLWALAPVFGWSTYDYEGVGVSCSIKWEEQSLNVISYNVTIFICVYLIPLFIIVLTNAVAVNTLRARRRRASINLNEAHAQRQYLVERRITITIILIITGFFIAWTPYAIATFIRAFIDPDLFSPIFGTLPALFAKTSVVWNPLIYVARNGNIRHHLPFRATTRAPEKNRTSDPTRFSTHPLSTVQLPLTSTSSNRQN